MLHHSHISASSLLCYDNFRYCIGLLLAWQHHCVASHSDRGDKYINLSINALYCCLRSSSYLYTNLLDINNRKVSCFSFLSLITVLDYHVVEQRYEL